MKCYARRREGCAVIVTVNGRLLDPRLDLYNHSPTGFEWGYCGSGPAQLALAILAEHLSDDAEALNLYQRFKWAVTEGTRLWSVYHSALGVKFWLITEANRRATTVLLPEDY